MGMYENLASLTPRTDEAMLAQVTDNATDLTRFIVDMTEAIFPEATPDTKKDFATGLHYGILLGIAYGAEFGMPDIAKNLYTVEPA